MTNAARFDVTTIGNALVDVLANADETFLQGNRITKGAMTLIDAERAATLYDLLGPAVQVSGGSAANTAAALVSFGGRAAFMGKVKADQLGAVFRHDLHAQGVHFATPPAPERRQAIEDVATDRRQGSATGRCLILVTPDAQRSMNTYLGAAVDFGPTDVQAEVIRDSSVTYLEGYLFDRPAAKEAFRYAARVTHQAGRMLALSLSDSFCVDRHRAEFRDLVKQQVDILFANTPELLSLYETDNFDTALAAVRKECKIAVVTRGAEGAVIVQGDQTTYIKAEPVAQLVDTTGAGDLFAAGFLFGLTAGKDMAECGRLGAVAAAEVISHFGPRPQKKLSSLI